MVDMRRLDLPRCRHQSTRQRFLRFVQVVGAALLNSPCTEHFSKCEAAASLHVESVHVCREVLERETTCSPRNVAMVTGVHGGDAGDPSRAVRESARLGLPPGGEAQGAAGGHGETQGARLRRDR